jgi:hypothetical protein
MSPKLSLTLALFLLRTPQILPLLLNEMLLAALLYVFLCLLRPKVLSTLSFFTLSSSQCFLLKAKLLILRQVLPMIFVVVAQHPLVGSDFAPDVAVCVHQGWRRSRRLS